VVENRGSARELAGDVQGRVETVERNPPEGRHRATGLYRTRPASPTTSTPLYENAPRLQLTPSKGAQVLTWITHLELNLVDDACSIESTSRPLRKTCQSETFHHRCQERLCKLGDITLEGVKDSSKGSGATPVGSLARPHGTSTTKI